MLTHNHSCQHCDCHWNCKIQLCSFPYNVSKWHDCGEREVYNRRMSRLLHDPKPCHHGCSKLPCVHNKWPDQLQGGRAIKAEFMRPRMLYGVVICDSNPVSSPMAMAQAQVSRLAQIVHVDTEITSYKADGQASLQREVQRQWVKNKIDCIADKYPEHIRSLIREHRGMK